MAFDVIADDGEDHAGRVCGRRHEAGVLRLSRHHAWHDHGLFPFHRSPHGRVWKFPHPASSRRARHGVSVPECAFLLGVPAVLHRHFRCLICCGRCAAWRLDRICSTERGSRRGAGTRHGYDAVDHGHRAIQRIGSDGNPQLHHNDSHAENQRHVHDAASLDPVVAAGNLDSRPSGVPRAVGCGHSAAVRQSRRDELLCARRHHHEPGAAEGSFRRPSAVVAAFVLVLRPS